jgi:hypothetical protein
MYEKDAKPLIIKMGHSGTIPSAIRADDLPEAIKTLEAALQAEQQVPPAENQSEEEHDEKKEAAIGSNVRAYPLLQMLKKAAQDHKPVMWEYNDSVIL